MCFDTQFYTDGEYQKIEGVTQLFQQDKSLVTVLLDEMIAKFGEGVRLVKVWRGPNYNSRSTAARLAGRVRGSRQDRDRGRNPAPAGQR